MGRISRDLSTLVRQELQLAKAELRQEAVRSGKGVGLLGAAGFAAFMLVLFGSLALWRALAAVLNDSVAALLVAVLWGALAALCYSLGRSRLREVDPAPHRTIETVHDVPVALSGHRGDTHVD